MTTARVLVAGVGNMFLGDDGFGVEVARLLADRPLPDEARVEDFGIRGFDLACALLAGHELVVLVDAAPRGGAPGTLYLIEPEMPQKSGQQPAGAQLEMHALDPVKVMAMAAMLGGPLARVLVVGCEPDPASLVEHEDQFLGLSDAVRAAIPKALELVERLLGEALAGSHAASAATA